MVEISVIVPTYNRSRLLERCLRSLLDQGYPRELYEIIVVDDGSPDNTEAMVRENFEGKVIYLRQENGGPAKARNTGLAKAGGRICAFTDDDCVLDRNWLACIRETFDKNPLAHCVNGDTQSVSTDPRSLSYILSRHIYLSSKSETNNIAYRREVFDRVGGFDETIPTPAYEDVEMKRRIEKAGFGRIYDPRAIAHHPYENEMADFKKQSRANGIGLSYYLRRHWVMGLVMLVYEAMYAPLILLYCFRDRHSVEYPIPYLQAVKSLWSLNGFWVGIFKPPRRVFKEYRDK